jgi:hypothetical protein
MDRARLVILGDVQVKWNTAHDGGRRGDPVHDTEHNGDVSRACNPWSFDDAVAFARPSTTGSI